MREKNPYGWIKELPEWEQQLWKEAANAASYERQNTGLPRLPGDWIPYGRIPMEFIPEPDIGPAGWTTGLAVSGSDHSGDNFRRWHRLRKAGL